MSRSTFNILFYANKSKEKNGIVPIMGRVTINETRSQFSCKKTISLDMWDVKGYSLSKAERRMFCNNLENIRLSASYWGALTKSHLHNGS